MDTIIPQLVINSLISGSLYALCSFGLALAYGVLRILNFSHGHLMMLGAYFFYSFSVLLKLSIILSAFLTSISLIIVSIISLKLFIIPFKKYNFILTLVTTLSLATILESLVSIFYGVNVKSISVSNFDSYNFFNLIFITKIQIVIILSSIIILSSLAFIIHKSSVGRIVRGLSENSELSESIGINSNKYTYIIYTVGVLIAGFAGIMIAFESSMQPTMGNNYTIKAFAAMILGGLGNLWGTIIGSYLLGFVENFAIGLDFKGFSIPAGYKDAFAYTIILLVLLFKPTGLFNSKKRSA